MKTKPNPAKKPDAATKMIAVCCDKCVQCKLCKLCEQGRKKLAARIRRAISAAATYAMLRERERALRIIDDERVHQNKPQTIKDCLSLNAPAKGAVKP